MKMNIKFVAYVSGLIIFLIYLFSADYIFNAMIKTPGEATLAEISLPVKTQNIQAKIEEVKKTRLKWKDGLFVRGWVFKDDGKIRERNVYLVLESKSGSIIFKVENDTINRPDIWALNTRESRNQNLGFELNIPAYLLKEKIYRVGFFLEDEAGKGYSYTDQEIRITKDVVEIHEGATRLANDSVQAANHFRLANPISLNLQSPGEKIEYFFDAVHGAGKYLRVQGWGFIPGTDAISIKHYIVLKNKGRTWFFDANVQVRPDITQHFNKSGLNLDSSGFLSTIPAENLENGTYQLGLYLVQGNRSGLEYLDKYDIDYTDNAIVVNNTIPADEKSLSHRELITLRAPTKNLNFHFERVDISSKYLTLAGWGFLVGLDAGNSKCYILLKKNGHITAFNITPQIRPDITLGFGKNLLNLDSTGFLSTIPKTSLENGKYQIGIYITRGDQCGIIYSNRFVELEP